MRPSLHIVLVLILLPPFASAQGLKGRIAGEITDAKTGEGLPSVNVVLKGTYHGAATDLGGNYVIDNVNPGEYTLEASLIGFTKVQYTGVKVSPGQPVRIDIKLAETVLTIGQEVVVVGERPLLDIEQASSSRTIQTEDIEALPARNVQDVVSDQVGVLKTAEGIYIRGSRSYETRYYVDGVSARDPLAGTGFGVDIGVNAIQEVEVTTGGIGAEYGGTAGVVSVKTREGSDKLKTFFSYKRDDLGLNSDDPSSYNSDLFEVNLSGPEPLSKFVLPALGIHLPGSATFFSSFTGYFSDEFTRKPAQQLNSSIFYGSRFAPRQDNRWGWLGKITYKLTPRQKFQFTYRRSVNINQNTRMLQIAGNNIVLRPGYQYEFALQPDNANTYTHDAILTSLKWTSTLSAKAFFEVQVSRLFTRLRADANGRPYRPDSITS
ncbi:MAG TPA: carboxypeptidase regulatory-like domain-containing protein, partial [Bacteroidota bacterium]